MIVKFTIEAHVEVPDGALPTPGILDFIEAGLRATVPGAICILPGASISVSRAAVAGRATRRKGTRKP